MLIDTQFLFRFSFLAIFSLNCIALNLDVDIERLGLEKIDRDKINITKYSFTEFERKAFSKEIIRQIRATGKVNDTPEVADYIQTLGSKLSKHNNAKIKFLVLNDKIINAFATLGGTISVNTGLIFASESEDELAGILAHEIAHVSQRHIERIIATNNDAESTSLQALLFATAVLSLGVNPVVTQAAVLTAIAFPTHKLVNYTRLHEAEADAVGFRILNNAKYNPNGMITMFGKIGKLSRYSSQPPEFLLTHPINKSRIAMLQSLSDIPINLTQKTNNYNYLTIKAILKLDNDKRFTQEELTNDAFRLAQAIRLVRAGEKAQAKQIVKKLIQNFKNNSVYFKLLIGQYYLADNQVDKALYWYNLAYQQDSKNLAVIVRLSEGLLSHNRQELAFIVLNSALAKFHTEPIIYKLFSKYFLLQNKLAEFYYSRAEFEFYSGYTERAVRQLFLAKAQKNNSFYLSAKIDANIQKFQMTAKLEKKR